MQHTVVARTSPIEMGALRKTEQNFSRATIVVAAQVGDHHLRGKLEIRIISCGGGSYSGE